MHRITERKKKFHMKLNKRLLFVGTLALIMATALTMSMLQLGSMESLAKGGTVTGSDSDGDAFWNGISVPSNLVISQKITVKDGNLSGEQKYTDTSYTKDISIPFAREGKFQPSISVETNNSHPNTGSDNQWQDYIDTWRYFSYAYCNSKGAITYYKLYTDNGKSNPDMGTTLFNYYKDHYEPAEGKRKSADMMLTTEENYGKILIPIVEACASENGWTKYTGSAIPLWQNQQTVKRVEMITVNPIDYWFGSYKADGSGYNSNDVDIMLYTSHSYNFKYTSSPVELEAPVVTTESGKGILNGDVLSEDDLVILSEGDNPVDSSKPQYYLSDKEVDKLAITGWENYTAPFSLNGKRYLYVRSNYASGSKNYLESGVDSYTIRYMNSSSAIVKSTPENGEYVDVRAEIQLSQNGASADGAIYYTVGASTAPTLTRVGYTERQNLNLDNLSADGKYVKSNDTVYIKQNGIWYKCSESSVERYKSSIIVDEQIRVKNSIVIYVYVEDDGKEVGEFQALRFSYAASEQTAAPESTVATSATSPATVNMGTTIELMCSTPGSKIFYTLNGSAPVIHITEHGPEAGAEYTKVYSDAEPIIVTERIAEYGSSFLVMAQAVTYVESDGQYYMVYQDSTVSRFNYIVAEQTPVESVQSVPQTNADTPVEVQVGSRIQLYSDTPDVDIYYTLDGSEPSFDKTTKEPGTNTYKYSGATGILIEKSTESSLFTVTAIAYKEGLALSDISRLVFAYPAAVSSPYANPISGAVSENTEVILKSATEGAVIYYEMANGDKVPNDPTTFSRVFDESNPIKITQKTTIKAYAVKNSMESTIAAFTYTVSDKLKVPSPSIGTGTVVSSGTVISLEADSGATVYYTLDGSDPRDSENKKVQVGSNVVLNGDAGAMIVLRTYAAKTGYSNSDVGTYSYSISSYIGGIYADRENGEIVKNGDVIYLHTDMSDATIFYTTDGSSPTEDSHLGNTVTIQGEPGEQITIMALAIAKGSEKTTSFATFTYSIMDKLSAPTASVPDGAIFRKESAVELKAETGKIYYTTDGSVPTTSSTRYQKSIVIDSAVTIRAIAVADDLEQSDISTFTYGFADRVAAPIASFASGELEMGTKVEFTCATEDATIYYRTDGGELNLSRKSELEIYSEPITINQATNFKVIAVKDKMQDSKILTVGYTVREPVVIETPEEEVQQNLENQSSRLQSRRSFSGTDAGPSYTDIVLKNASYGAVVAAEEGALPDMVQLVVKQTNVTDAATRRVKQVVGDSYGVVASYDVTLLYNGEVTQPEGTIEIGLPIPVEYENAMIYIVHVQEDGNIELFETRRSGGVAYAKVDHLSVFSITAPVEFEEEADDFPWLPILYTLAVSLTGIGIWLIYKAGKAKREDGMQDV